MVERESDAPVGIIRHNLCPPTLRGRRRFAPTFCAASGESLVFTFPDDLDIEPIIVTALDNGKIGIEAPDEVKIVRSELLDS